MKKPVITDKLPTGLNCGGVHIDVHEKEKNNTALGESCIAETKIDIYNKFMDNNEEYTQSFESKKNTFYHELTHCILSTMGEDDLNSNEKFVNTFGSLLTEAMQSLEFGGKENSSND